MITSQNNGFEFVKFLSISETEINHYHPLAGSFAIVECEGNYLLCYNKWRNQWELPAGKREESETPIECAKRELYEETGQLVIDMEFKGLAVVRNSTTGHLKFNPIYTSTINSLQPFKGNAETNEIRLWNLKDDLLIDEVDFLILKSLKGGRP